MTIVELKKAIESKRIEYGVKQALKNQPDKVFLSNDARAETEAILKEKGIAVQRLQEDKEKIAKDLKLGFLSEVFSVHGVIKPRKDEPKEEKKAKKTKAKKESKEEKKEIELEEEEEKE